MALDTVQDYLTRARVLLQDEVAPYRYSDDVLVEGMNLGLLEARRLRADLFLSQLRQGTVPEYSSAGPAASVALDNQYRVALLYYMVGHAQLQDGEDPTDQRATVFLNKFVAQLLSVQS